MSEQVQSRFLQPLDVLYLRGNRLFGGAGDYAEALMPPWPSLVSGALRSRMMADAEVDWHAFKRGSYQSNIRDVIGTPENPGSFSVRQFTVAKKNKDTFSCFYPIPMDLYLTIKNKKPQLTYLQPQSAIKGIHSNARLKQYAVLKTSGRSKPESGYWLNDSGWKKYHAGDPILENDIQAINALWKRDLRLGIAIDQQSKTAEESKIYTTEVIQFMPDIGFMVSVMGGGETLANDGLIRLGADGHAAHVSLATPHSADSHWDTIKSQNKFRLVTITPAIFEAGWLPPGINKESRVLIIGNSKARLVCASLPRNQVISGWDLVNWRPKDALKTVPVGSVYWFDQFEGDISDLQKLQQNGFWQLTEYPDNNRKAEGFNHLTIAPWAQA